MDELHLGGIRAADVTCVCACACHRKVFSDTHLIRATKLRKLGVVACSAAAAVNYMYNIMFTGELCF